MFDHGSYSFVHDLGLTHKLVSAAMCVCMGEVLPKVLPFHTQLSPLPSLYPQGHSHDKISQAVYTKVDQSQSSPQKKKSRMVL